MEGKVVRFVVETGRGEEPERGDGGEGGKGKKGRRK